MRKVPKPVPSGMKVQLGRLFGSDSPEAKAAVRTDAQWRQTLSSVLAELFKYLEQNVHTDEMHWTMLYTGFAAAADSLKHDDFWPGYAEGITRIALLLMGDYPDHKTRGAGRKKKQHYRLSRFRDVRYLQTPTQKVNTLLGAHQFGIPMTKSPADALSEFRKEHGFGAGFDVFVRWFREHYPADYASIF